MHLDDYIPMIMLNAEYVFICKELNKLGALSDSEYEKTLLRCVEEIKSCEHDIVLNCKARTKNSMR